ncbi:hypothetical protein AeNC1_014465, partial [Aphanomyces euteiches]
METLLKQITTFDVRAPWSDQLQALADIKAVAEQVLRVDSLDAVVDTLIILTEPVKTDCWIELIRTDVVHRAHRFLCGNLPKLFGIKADNRRTKRTKSFGESFTTLPYVYVRKNDERDPTVRVLDEGLTKELLLSMPEIATGGVSFVGKNALVTGCGCDSIASEVVKSLLEGGATVICTTSSFSSKSTKFFRSMYENH